MDIIPHSIIHKKKKMAARKVSNPGLMKMEQRLTGMKSISTTLELHNGISVVGGEALKADFKKAEEEYNIMLKNLNIKKDEVKNLEKKLLDFCKTSLVAVKSQFGDDSNEYELTGGTRASKRQKPTRKAAKAAKAPKKQTATA